MILNALTKISLAVAFGWAAPPTHSPSPHSALRTPYYYQAPDGRWDGTITYGALNLPFTIHFEPNGKNLTGFFMNGNTRVSSTEGSFEAGTVRLTFGTTGTRLEARLVEGQLTGTYGSGGQDMHPFTASKFCACAFEGEAGPDITGTWGVSDSNWRLTIKRKGEDTLATVSRPSGDLGPLVGRSDGLTFRLYYFDGVRAAVLEIEQRKDGALDLKFTERGAEVKKYQAVQAIPK